MSGTLYIVATPIGNLEDITLRAKRVLSGADIIAAEDTRMARKLMGLLGISNKTVSNHKFNEKKQAEYLLAELMAGKDIALVSDAGTPCVSDPGGLLVACAVGQGVPVVSVGGISAVTAALSVSGFAFTAFIFYGFMPRAAGEIRKLIAPTCGGGLSASAVSGTVAVFFESPKRIKRTLVVFIDTVPDAALCLCNDLTKMHERIYRGTPREVWEALDANPSAEKGEYTLVARFPPAEALAPEETLSREALLTDYMIKNSCGIKEAVNELAARHKNKKEWYAASLRLRELL